MNALDLIADEDKEKVKNALLSVFKGGHATVEAGFKTKNGESIPFVYSGLRIIIDKKQYCTGMGINITEQKKLEEQARYIKKRAKTVSGFTDNRCSYLSAKTLNTYSIR